jgi:pimeloyl-ACP methyl ester carboxylesterase
MRVVRETAERAAWLLVIGFCFIGSAGRASAQRTVNFPPAEAPPPPPAKAPPKTQAGGEETDIIPDPGPSMRKTQHRTPPPPTNLTVIHKIEYGETLQYKHPNGVVQKFEQWKSYPNDAINLVTMTNERLADGNNYQYATKPLASPGFDPVDIPILYMTGDYDFTLKPAEVENLRKFITQGGTVIFNAARGRDEFSRAVIREMRRVFPQKSFMRLPTDHPIFNARFRIQQVMMLLNGVQTARSPEVYSIDIGTRAAAILVPGGLGAALSGTEYHPDGRHIVGESAKRLGVNLVAYMLGSTEYGRFLAQDFPVYTGRTKSGDVVRFASLRYAGSWDLNPAIQNSVFSSLKENTSIDVDFTPHHVTLDDKAAGHFPLLFMTGHYDFQFTDAEATGLARYLNRGGLLVVSAGAGLKPFDKAFKRELKKALPSAELIKLPPSHALFAGGWNAIERVTFTPAALRDNPTLDAPEFYGLFLDGRLALLYTPYDLMSGVNRESNAYAKGLIDTDAMRMVNNIITYALSH